MGTKREPEFSIVLIPAPDDAPKHSKEYQSEVKAFADSLAEQGIEFNSLMRFQESASGGGFSLGEFFIFTTTILPALLVPLTMWIRGRYRRKVKLKFKDVAVEATSVDEIEKLLKMAKKHSKKSGRK